MMRSWCEKTSCGTSRWGKTISERRTRGPTKSVWRCRRGVVRIATASFFMAVWLQATFGGFGFTPQSDRSELIMTVQTPPGSNVEYTKRKTEEEARVARSRTDLV